MIKLFTWLRRPALGAAMALFAVGAAGAVDVDFTDFIVNNSFENGLSGWEQSGMKVQNNTTFPLKAGDNYVEKWVPNTSGADKCKVAQTVADLLPGGYTLTVAAQNLLEGSDALQTGVVIFAGEQTTAVNVVADYKVDFTVGADGQVTVGYEADGATGNYLACDNFRLTFTRYDAEQMKVFTDKISGQAEALAAKKMDKAAAKALADAISAFKTAATGSDVAATAAALKTIHAAMAAAEESVQAYATLADAIAALRTAYEEIKGKPGADSIETLINDAAGKYDAAELTVEEAELLTANLENAILMYRIGQSKAEEPVVKTNPYVARGATFALGRSTVKAPEGATILESGFCWSTEHEPTVADFRSSKAFKHNGTIYHMKGLKPSTVYYVRAYAITSEYAVGYGDEVCVITIPKGTITYSYNPNDATDDQSKRILSATAEAVDYWNNSTSIAGYHVSVSYNAGVNTADCSYGGWVRVGPRENYQRTGTLMHEMNHGVGVGQHTIWYGPDSPFRVDGTRGDWKGSRANALVQFLQNDPTAVLHGDTQHMWPYGINGAHEDDGTELLYLANGLVTQALGEDALPPVAGSFHTPSYTMPVKADTKYYIKAEDPEYGAYTRYVVETEENTVTWTDMKSDDALANDRAAWYMTFDPVTCYYTMVNAQTGNYLALDLEHRAKVITVAEPNENYATNVQLTPSIEKVTVEGLTGHTYWISVGPGESPRSLALKTTGELNYANQRYSGTSAKRQRWHIVTEAAMPEFDKAAASVEDIAVAPTAMFPADVYDITGRQVKKNASDLTGLRPGVYIVGTQKVYVK